MRPKAEWAVRKREHRWDMQVSKEVSQAEVTRGAGGGSFSEGATPESPGIAGWGLAGRPIAGEEEHTECSSERMSLIPSRATESGTQERVSQVRNSDTAAAQSQAAMAGTTGSSISKVTNREPQVATRRSSETGTLSLPMKWWSLRARKETMASGLGMKDEGGGDLGTGERGALDLPLSGRVGGMGGGGMASGGAGAFLGISERLTTMMRSAAFLLETISINMWLTIGTPLRWTD